MKTPTMKTISLLSVSWVLSTSATDIRAEDRDGILVEANGPVEVLRLEDDSWQSCAAGAKLRTGDTVHTGAKGRAFIRLGDTIELRHGSNTTEEIQVPEEGAGQPRSVALLLGVLISKVMTPAGGETPFEVQTGNAVAGVRGTEFTIATGLDGLVRTAVQTGEVLLTGDAGEVSLTPGQMSEVTVGQPPKPPESAAGVDLEGWVQARTEAVLANVSQFSERLEAEAAQVRSRLDQLRAKKDQLAQHIQELAGKARTARHGLQGAAQVKIQGRLLGLLQEEVEIRRGLRLEIVRLSAGRMRLNELLAASRAAGESVGADRTTVTAEGKARELPALDRERDVAIRKLRREILLDLSNQIVRERKLMREFNLQYRELQEKFKRDSLRLLKKPKGD